MILQSSSSFFFLSLSLFRVILHLLWDILAIITCNARNLISIFYLGAAMKTTALAVIVSTQ